MALARSAVSASSASSSGRVSSSSCTRACSRASRSPSSAAWAGEGLGLGGGVAPVGLDALEPVGGGGEAAVVLVELAGQRGLGLAGLVEQRAGAVQARLGVVGARRWPRRPAARASSRAAPVAPVDAVPTRQPDGPKRPPARVTTTASGWARAASTAAGQPPSTATAPPSRASSSGATSARRARTWRAHRLADRRRRREPVRWAPRASTAPPMASSPSACSAPMAARAAATPSTTTAASASPAAASTAASQPGVDLDEVEERADDAVDRRQPLGAGARAGLVEGEAQGLGPGGPGVPIAVGGAERGLGLGDLLLGGGARAARRRPGARRAGPRPARPRAASARSRPASASSRPSFSCSVARRAWARPSSCSPRSTPDRSAASSPAPLGRPTGGRGDAFGPLALEAGAGVGERGLGLRELVLLGASAAASASASASSAAEAGGLGLEGGDHGLVDEGAALAVDAAAALGQHGDQAAGLLPERLEAHQRVAEVVAAGVPELGLGGQHAGVELGQGAPQEVVLGGQLGAGGAAVAEAAPQGGELATGEEEVQRAELGDEVAVAAGRVGLALERAAAGDGPRGAGRRAG